MATKGLLLVFHAHIYCHLDGRSAFERYRQQPLSGSICPPDTSQGIARGRCYGGVTFSYGTTAIPSTTAYCLRAMLRWV